MNKFEQATREKLRFSSMKGDLTTEQLWDLPLQSKTGFDLDTIAKQVNRQLKSMEEESFVDSKPNPGKAKAELQLDILKHIIAVRMKENEEIRNAAARKAEREKLIAILGDKQDEALRNMTPEEIQKRIDELSK